jgi:hypothetical protein
VERSKGSETRERPTTTPRPTRPESKRAPKSDTIFWWHLANVIDLVHFPFLIVMVVLGAVYFSGPVFAFLITLMVTLQIAVLGCPVMWLTGQLRQIRDPDYEVKWSFTAWLYDHHGRWVGVAVFCFFAALTLVLRYWLI